MPTMHPEPAVQLLLTFNVLGAAELVRPNNTSCAVALLVQCSPEGLAAKSIAFKAFQSMPTMHSGPAVPLLLTSNVLGAAEMVRSDYVLVQRVNEAAGQPLGLAAMSITVGASANEPAILHEPAKNTGFDF